MKMEVTRQFIENSKIDIGEMPSLYETIMQDFYKKAWTEFDQRLKTYLKENLLQFGYKFETDEDFIDFCKERVSRLSYEHNNYHEFYLDHVNEEDKGKFIGCYSDKINIINEGSKITAVIG